MTCSFCSKPISFFRSMVDSQFCCPDHRKREAEQLRTLALERLEQNSRDMSGLLAKPESLLSA